ncbi:MAG TPA: indole-3-glycerol phosphate synthase TrpC [Patescibacteria group bacterium]|nr:indole-3-glycerol phosphate synthase TrpC [Patescibacteria group bacterium]
MSVLAEICEKKLKHVAAREKKVPLAKIRELAKKAGPVRPFEEKIREFKADSQPALIAEIKKASPSAGVIRKMFDPATLARDYRAGGACCLSVLTDEPYFQGHDEFIAQVRDAVRLPVLRKDFILTPYQVYESRALGADCILLIMAAIDDEMASELYDIAGGLGMGVLLEVHDSDELHRAFALGGGMIGVNSRDLKTLKVDLETAMDLAKGMSGEYVTVAESGITSNADIEKLRAAGYSAFLVGESLMREDDVRLATRRLLGTEQAA